MEIGDSSKWGEEYSNMRHSTPSGNLTIYWNVDQEKGFVEFALAAKTDAWVSFAIRPEYVVGRPPPLISSYISSDKLLSPSKPPDEDKHVEEHQELPQLEDEATPPTEIDEGVDLPDPNAANWVRVEDDKPEPIIAKDIGDPSAQFPWVESESLVGIEIPVQTSMELDAILPPCGIETISAATEELQAQSCSASEKGETVYFEVQSEGGNHLSAKAISTLSLVARQDVR